MSEYSLMLGGNKMIQSIQTAAVIGSGVMGAQIAAHLANCGVFVRLLDVVPERLTKEEETRGLKLEDPVVRNRLAEEGKRRLKKLKPSPITSHEILERITPGNMDDDMEALHDADWIIEAVTERLGVKQKVLSAIDRHRKNGSIVSTNTSGISIHQMVEDCSENLKKHFIGTHFFNPPRYLKLVELIPSKFTDQKVLSFMHRFLENILGKGVVAAKDTPNFIANRIGTYGLLRTVKEMNERNLSVGEVDSITGTLIGRPKSATFRTLDIVGLDTFMHVAGNIYEKTEGAEKESFRIPDEVKSMVEQRKLGAKVGQGFYKKENGEILELNMKSFAYTKRKTLTTPAIQSAQRQKGTKNKVKDIIRYKGDQASDFIWSILKQTLLYTAEVFSHIANDIASVDQAMRWGFGWEHGPFEIWDIIGVEHSVERMKAEGEEIPAWLTTFLKNGNASFYKMKEDHVFFYNPEQVSYKQHVFNEKEIHIHLMKNEKTIIKQNKGASLLDIGDGIALLEFHSKSNAIGLDILHMVNESIEVTENNYDGLIIGNQGKNFSVGANLAWMLMEAQDENFDELYLVIKKFQETAMRIKYAVKPVVAAAFQMTLGGGAEMVLPAASIQAAQETYIGLVETGVGLIPGGGGTKELYLKQFRNLPAKESSNVIQLANNVFETVAAARTSTSAREAYTLGFLGPADGISVHPDHLLFDAKEKVLSLAKSNYQAPVPEKIQVPGEAGYGAMRMGAKTMQYSGYASEHDVKIAEKLAYVLSGGRVREGVRIEEQTMLALEREAFLSLLGEPLTQARMQHMLVKGKPLRN